MKLLDASAKYFRLQTAYLKNAQVRKNQSSQDVSVIVASAHKVGSTWIFNVLTEIGLFRPDVLPRHCRIVAQAPRLIDLEKPEALSYLRSKAGFCLYKTHSPPVDYLDANIRFMTVFRDLRDAAVSNAFYLANLSADQGGWPEMQEMDITDRIAHYLNKASYDLDLTEAWYRHPNTVKVFYEEMKQDTFQTMRVAIKQLGLEIPPETLQQAISLSAFRRKSGGRSTGEEKKNSFYRKGIVGDWKQYFDSRLVATFRTAQGGGWYRLLKEIGYSDF